MRLIRTSNHKTKVTVDALAERGGIALDSVSPAVDRILRAVRRKGDSAVRRYACEFDGLAKRQPLLIDPRETAAAWGRLDPTLKEALEIAAANIRSFAQLQLPQSWQASQRDGLNTGQLVRPIESVGCYVPGGRHPLPSTMLMTVIPAQVAGVRRMVVTSPRPAQATLATAHLLGVTEFYRIGGAHAVAALAYGTESISRVAKIVGPGSLYVTAAKRALAFDCAIDMLAGPTEIVVISDLGDATGIAADLVAQAEHDPEALAIFVTTSEALARAVIKEVKERSHDNPIAKQALKSNGYAIVAESPEQAHDITNRLAPEHLTIDSADDLKWVQNAGSIFIGKYSPQPMGDYISGPNHTLPTGGQAAVRGGLSVMDFVKLITVQEYSAAGLASLGPQAVCLAEAEGLTAHAQAIRSRITAAEEKRP